MLVVSGAFATVPVRAADLVLFGHGWGHGVGLSQWGARGFAERDDRSYRWILDHYFPGTTLQRTGAARIRVLLKDAGSAKVCSATRARGPNGRSVTLSVHRSYRAAPWRGDGLALIDTTTRRVRARLPAPVRVTGGSSTCLRGTALNDRADREYRGVLVLARDGEDVRVINDVALRHYLYGVVPAEMPPYWPAAALEAQAVAARSYAVRSLDADGTYDVLPNQASQVYGGVQEESAATTRAVQRTDPLVLTAGGDVAATYFSSSSGGRTAAAEEGFPGAEPVSYLRSVPDPWDRLSPDHAWTARFSDRALRKKLAGALKGAFREMRVTARTPTGRAATVRVTGAKGVAEVPAATIRARLELKSVWFSVRRSSRR
jgi:stage II sporulation protein D